MEEETFQSWLMSVTTEVRGIQTEKLLKMIKINKRKTQRAELKTSPVTQELNEWE